MGLGLAGCSKSMPKDQAEAICASNLYKIVLAKAKYANAHSMTNGQYIWEGQIGECIEGGWDTIKCPYQGHYYINPVLQPASSNLIGAAGQAPVCSTHGSAIQLLANKVLESIGTNAANSRH